MIYLIAVALSLVSCGLSFACEIITGNMTHLRYGREPNAGVALFPTIPFVQFVFVGAAWLVDFLVPSVAFWLFTILCLVLVGLQTVALRRLRAEWKQVSQSRTLPKA